MMQTETKLTRLSPFLANSFSADYLEDVPRDVVIGSYDAAKKVLANPERYPKADFDFLEQEALELEGIVTCWKIEDAANAQIRKAAALDAAIFSPNFSHSRRGDGCCRDVVWVYHLDTSSPSGVLLAASGDYSIVEPMLERAGRAFPISPTEKRA